MKLPDIPGRIMAQMAIAPQRKIKNRLEGVSAGRNRYVECNNDPDDITQDRFPIPFLDIFGNEPGGSKYQSEEEGPDQNRVVCQQPGDDFCQREDTDPDPCNDG